MIATVVRSRKLPPREIRSTSWCLATADRYSAGGIHAHYAYTYDAADNMTAKVEPLFDDFDDGDYAGWNVWGGTWSAANGYLRGTTAGGTIARSQTAGNVEIDSWKWVAVPIFALPLRYLRNGRSGGWIHWLCQR